MNPTTTKKEAILATALTLFAEHGFAHVSIAMIADQSKVTKSLIFHHFGNKEQLWDEVKQHYFTQYAKTQEVLFEQEKNPLALIEKSVRNYFDFIQQNPLVARFFSYAHLDNDDSCGDLDRPLIDQANLLIRSAQNQGLIRSSINPTVLIMTFITGINQYFVARCRFQQWDADLYQDNDTFINGFIELLMAGITP
ncbi:TetR/AcrR family transcriptional regulator [Marinicella gelatinilytica]|uniref:TetR/AcrR family transcriptional regulator n=1 Tax=Marinicella gelatinilytica TaxID=2996017 RepID=UPI002261036E|nr:TetR/AcrR family transcriptional regulator [Marinicella gelatinilytica]MCX7544866.1 TetR/AcrR family transcriptional regulator [Marinicella gelatinilytica]